MKRHLRTPYFLLSVSLYFGVLMLLGCNWRHAPPLVPVEASGQIRTFHEEQGREAVRRVVVLPIEIGTFDARFGNELTSSLSKNLRKNGYFEVIQLSKSDFDYCSESVIQNGRYDEYVLLNLQQKYNADGVVFARLNRYRAYSPISADVVAHLVDCRNAAVLATVDGTWDLNSPDDNFRLQDFVYASPMSFERTELAAQSPLIVAAFIASEIAARLH